MDPLVITCAPVGAELRPDQTPYLPYTPQLLGETAKAVRDAGASIIHVHCRNDDGTNTHSVERFREAYDAIRAQSDLIVQFSSGGAIGMTPEERAAPLSLRPEMATLTCGSVNFGDDIFENSFPIMRGILKKMNEYGVRPELEIFDKGHISNARKLARERLLSLPQHVDLVLGVPGGLDATVQNRRDAPGRSPESGGSNCRWRWPRLRWAVTCGLVWKTIFTIAGAGWRATKSSSRASFGSLPRPAVRSPRQTRREKSWAWKRRRRGERPLNVQ
jgi:3-keto-5-aminohexanoate cleavage enzyme